MNRRRPIRHDETERRAFALFVVLIAIAILCGGCSRAYYRRNADIAAHSVIREHANHPQWPLNNFNVYVDTRSRMFDPFNPDGPPMPPDDPTATALMYQVNGKKGWPGWHRNGDVPFVDDPNWLNYLPLDEKSVLHLNSQNTIELAFLHSRVYQGEIEQVYLSALDVTFERFRFNSQLFAGYQANYSALGPRRAGDGGQSQSNFSAGTFSTQPTANAVTLNRLFTTGAELVVSFANTLMWQFSGPNTYQGNTLINFTFLQPLLLNAGRDRIMERLTFAERTLLYNVRLMERFKGQFYVDIMTGRPAGAGPTRKGGLLGGSGFDGFSGLGNAGFGTVATIAQVNNQNTGTPASGAGANLAGGYMGLLQQKQQIRNQQDNINRLRANLYRLDTALLEMLTTIPTDQEQIPRQRLQVAQAKQALFVAEGRLINAQNTFEQTLDAHKVEVGLPPEICTHVEDPMLDRFNLLDDAIKPRQDKIEEVIQGVGRINDRILVLAKETQDPQLNIMIRSLTWSKDLQDRIAQLKTNMEPIKKVAQEINEVNVQRAVEDLKKLSEALPRRRKELLRLKKKYEEQKNVPCSLMPLPQFDDLVFGTERLEDLEEILGQELKRLQKNLGAFDSRLQELDRGVKEVQTTGKDLEPRKLFDLVRDKTVLFSQDLLSDLRIDLLALELLQVRARTEAMELIPVDLPACEAMKIASTYRQDVMNARGALIDEYRLIEYNADNLESTLNFVFSGDVGNTTRNPLNLNSETGRLSAGVQFEAPITRLQERNTYRQCLIEYQQARRNYYAYEDTVSQGLRTTLRTIEANQYNFELQRYAVLIAAQQLDLNEDIRVLKEALRQPSGVTAARDSVSALTDLLNAQNDFLSVWVNYEVLRRYLDLDLGTMQLDPDMNWIDPGPVGPDFAKILEVRLGTCEPIQPELPLEFTQNVPPERIIPGNPSAEIVVPGTPRKDSAQDSDTASPPAPPTKKPKKPMPKMELPAPAEPADASPSPALDSTTEETATVPLLQFSRIPSRIPTMSKRPATKAKIEKQEAPSSSGEVEQSSLNTPPSRSTADAPSSTLESTISNAVSNKTASLPVLDDGLPPEPPVLKHVNFESPEPPTSDPPPAAPSSQPIPSPKKATKTNVRDIQRPRRAGSLLPTSP